MSLSRRGFLFGSAAVIVAAKIPTVPVRAVGTVPILPFRDPFLETVNLHYIRSQIWSRQIKEMLMEELQSMGYVEVFHDTDY